LGDRDKLQELRANYEQMSEGELLSLALERDLLTDVARSILNEELARRGLGENEVESWEHPPAPPRRTRRKSYWERNRNRWRAQIKRSYNRLPFSPFWLVSVLYLLVFSRLKTWGRESPELAGLGFLALTIILLVIVILLPARPGKVESVGRESRHLSVEKDARSN